MRLVLMLVSSLFFTIANAGWSTSPSGRYVSMAAVLAGTTASSTRVFAYTIRDGRWSFESTDDDGLTWQLRSLQPASSDFPYWIGSAPAPDGTPGNSVLYASVVTGVEISACDFFRSTDRGVTWVRLSNVAACSFAVDPSDPNVIYGIDHNGFFAVGPSLTVRSVDGGYNWSYVPSYGGNDVRAAADGTIYTPAGCSYARSRDRATTWTLFEGWPGARNECVYANDLLPVRHPVHGDAYLIIATNNGLYESTDRGATLRPMGLRAFDIRKLAFGGYRADGGVDVLFSYVGGVGVARIGADYNLLWPLQANLPPGTLADGVAGGGYAYGSAGLSVCRKMDDCIGGTLPTFVDAVEFRNTALDHYFITADPAEASAIDKGAAGPEWGRTGVTFPVYRDGTGGGYAIGAVCRYIRTAQNGTPSHFHALIGSECQRLATDKAWRLESDSSFFAYQTANGNFPRVTAPGNCGIRRDLFRLFNNRAGQNDGNHRYTTDPALYDRMIAQGWIGEGVRMCVPRVTP